MWPMWPMPLCTRRSTWDFFGYRWNVEMWKKNVDSVEKGWVPCKARCPAVVSPGHFSLLKSSQNHFQLPARWLASVFASEITSTKVPSTAARCKAAEASWLRCQTNSLKKSTWKKIDLQASWHACWYTASQIQCEDSHNTRRSTGWPYALPSHGSKTQCEKTCTTTMLLQKSGQKSFNFF